MYRLLLFFSSQISIQELIKLIVTALTIDNVILVWNYSNQFSLICFDNDSLSNKTICVYQIDLKKVFLEVDLVNCLI